MLLSMNKNSVEDAIKQLVLANADGEIKSLAYIMINQDGEPEMQIAIAPGNMYVMISAIEILKLRIIDKLISDGEYKPKDRE